MLMLCRLLPLPRPRRLPPLADTVHICYWWLASASADHATTLQVPSTKTAGLPMVDATCNVRRCWMHASTAIELNPHVIACATLHAKSWCLFVCHLYTLPGKEGPGSTTPAPPGSGRLNASHSLARVQILFEPLVSKSWSTGSCVQPQPLQPQLLLSAVWKWALAQESWQSCLQTRHVW